MPQPAVKLRGHHLLCLLTHIGRGYTDDFIANIGAIIDRLNAGAMTELVAGPDDICAGLQNISGASCPDAAHCLKPAAAERDNKALQDVSNALGMPLAVGTRFAFTPEMVARLRGFFAVGAVRSACSGCEWHGLCTSIAARGFDGVKLYPHADR